MSSCWTVTAPCSKGQASDTNSQQSLPTRGNSRGTLWRKQCAPSSHSFHWHDVLNTAHLLLNQLNCNYFRSECLWWVADGLTPGPKSNFWVCVLETPELQWEYTMPCCAPGEESRNGLCSCTHVFWQSKILIWNAEQRCSVREVRLSTIASVTDFSQTKILLPFFLTNAVFS